MPVVDSHCHASPVWYGSADDLLYHMGRHGVDGAILIQIQYEYNSDYQFEVVRQHPGRFASVVIVDIARPDAVQELERQAERGASGVRLQTFARSGGDDPLLIWRAAERLGLAVSCVGPSDDFASEGFAALVEALPDLKIVIEHLGGVKVGETAPEAIERIWALSRFPNTYIKIPGLGEFCRRALPVTQPFPFVTPIPEYLAEVYRAFGARRMMWGSDFPPVSGREGYEHALKLTRAEFLAMAGVSDEDREWIFGGTAAEVFPLR